MKQQNFCHDCKQAMKIEKGKVIGGMCLGYDWNGETIYILKCNDCYEKDKSLRNFQECEVYSRVVGYLRPVSQWNPGKRQEYKDKVDYKF